MSTTLERLFGIKAFGKLGETGEDETRTHEFEPEAEISDAAVVVCPGILMVTPDEALVIFKAVVNAKREISDAE